MSMLMNGSRNWLGLRKTTGSRRRNVYRPAPIEKFEDRIVPAAISPFQARSMGWVTIQAWNGGPRTFGAGDYAYQNGEICVRVALTESGLQRLEGTDDWIDVGFASYTLLDGDSKAHSTQEPLDHDSAQLTFSVTTATLCVVVDDKLCTQVDVYTGSDPLVINPWPNPDAGRFFQGAIYQGSTYITNNLDLLDPSDGCCDVNRGQQGLSQGYWRNHESSWQLYTPTTTLGSVFSSLAGNSTFKDATFRTAIRYGGGPGINGAIQNLMRQAVAGLLNAAHTGIAYPLTTGQIKVAVNDAIESGDRQTILNLAGVLDGYNNLHGVTI